MSKVKVITAQEAANLVKDGDTVLIGGFMTNGTPKTVVHKITAKDLTVICNDAGYPNEGTGRLLSNGLVKRLIASHVGLNKDVATLYNEGKIELKLQPQGTLAEQIRAAGAGLGGFLTPTGVGTVVEDSSFDTTLEGKKVIEFEGEKYIIEKPLKGNIAFIQGFVADKAGNIRYRGSGRNFNPIMACAADIVVAEVESIVPEGDIGANFVETPHIFIDYIVIKEDE